VSGGGRMGPVVTSAVARGRSHGAVEAKAKDLALRRLRDQLGERDRRWEEGRLLAPQSLEVSSRRKPGKRPAPKSK
jgi:hypothetical protein